MEILCYTRAPQEDIIYAGRLAYSMHLAYRGEDGSFRPFHHNEGILYAKAVQDEKSGVLDARSLKKPWLFTYADGSYGAAAIRTGADGEKDVDSEGCVLLFKSKDLVHYDEIGLYRVQQNGFIEEIRCAYDAERQTYKICWLTEGTEWMEGEIPDFGQMRIGSAAKASKPRIPKPEVNAEKTKLIEGICPGNIIEIPEDAGEYLMKKLLAPVCVGMELSAKGPYSRETLETMKAVARYSDGSSVERKIDWERITDDSASGRVHQEQFPAPFALNRADPVCMYRDGRYYFMATNDADGNHTLYMRCADTLEGIVTAKEELFLDSDTYPGIGGLLWAPEFHEIGGKLYVFHAATPGEFFCEESHVRRLEDGADPMRMQAWSAPVKVIKKDGTPLCEEGKVISLDMTTFEYEKKVYAMWSQRQFLPVDQGAWLYLAQIDEEEPWKLLSDPVCIAKPEYGWENNHTYVVEGPYALERNGQLMVTYAAAAIDATYTVGLLKPVMGSDILKPQNWHKSNYPLMSSRSAEGQYGPGHNSYVTDENGLTWNFYHMKPGVEAPRSSAARRVHFDIDGEPMLDVTQKLDLPEKFRTVEVKLSKS